MVLRTLKVVCEVLLVIYAVKTFPTNMMKQYTIQVYSIYNILYQTIVFT